MVRPPLALALVFVALGSAPGPTTPPWSGKVVTIADGDTLSILRDGRDVVRVRLWGIDAPEAGQDHGDKARRRLVELAAGKTARVEPVELDRYGRMVARVRIGAANLGTIQVRDGFAWWFRRHASGAVELEQAEAEARAARRGLWSAPVAPVAPWDWRSGGGLPPDVAGRFVASKRSTVYHAPGCRSIPRIAPANRVTFDSAEAATASGRSPAKDCR